MAKSYDQYCSVAAALDVIGERWSLLILRDLLDGPKRYTDLQRSLTGSEGLQQRCGDGIVGAVQAMHPFLHHVDVTQFSQAAEEALACLLHFFPRWIRVDGRDAVSHGTTAAKGHTQVVHRIGCEDDAGALAFFQDALHPES